MDEQGIQLAETIRAVRKELLTAQDEGRNEALRFTVEEVELELKFEVARSSGADANISFWVVSLGGKGEKSTSSTHSIRLKLGTNFQSGDQQIGSQEYDRPDSPESKKFD